MRAFGAGSSDHGPNRPKNQDAFLVSNELGLYLVSDGMGGHRSGEVASRMTADVIAKHIREHVDEVRAIEVPRERRGALLRLMTEAIQRACEAVHEAAQEREECRGMGATATALLVNDHEAVMGHVGDSRLYLMRGDSIHQISHDHTLIQEMIDRGALTRAEVGKSPYAHVLSRAIGTHQSVQVDTLLLDVLPGDRFLICSDGLLTGLSDGFEAVKSLRNRNPKQAARELVVAACAQKTTDNASAVVVSIEADEEEAEEQEVRRSEVTMKMQSLKSVYMFQHLELSELARVVDLATVRYIRRGESVFHEGDNDRSLYIILIGELQVMQEGKLVATLRQGNHFGEMALLAGRNRAFQVVAVRDSKLLQIAEGDFKRLIQDRPVTGVKLLSEISRELGRRLYRSSRVR